MKKLEEFINGKFAICCDTEEDIRELFDILDKSGIAWSDGETLDNIRYLPEYRSLCYSVHNKNELYNEDTHHLRMVSKKVINYRHLVEIKDDMYTKYKVKIKTLEEIIDTDGVRVEDGVIYKRNSHITIEDEYRKFLGKEFIIDDHYKVATLDNERFYVQRWMCSKWEEIFDDSFKMTDKFLLEQAIRSINSLKDDLIQDRQRKENNIKTINNIQIMLKKFYEKL